MTGLRSRWRLRGVLTVALGAAVSGCASADPASSGSTGEGWRSLFDGRDLSAWKIPEGDNGHWRVVNGVIDYDALSEAPGDKHLWTKESFRNFVLRADWRIKEYSGEYDVPTVLPDGSYLTDAEGKVVTTRRPNADSGIYLRGTDKAQVNIWTWPIGSGEVYGFRMDRTMPPEVRAAVTPKKRADRPVGEWNTFVITMRDELLTVELNGETVIDRARLPGIPSSGPIALQHHGRGKPHPASSLVQFRNISIQELP